MQKVFISNSTPFGNLIRVAEGMSYNNDQFELCARGLQIQRLFDVLTLLSARNRVEDTLFSFTHITNEGKHIPELVVTCTSTKEN